LRGKIAASGINIVLVARREDLLKEVGVEYSKRYGVEHRVVVLDVYTETEIETYSAEELGQLFGACTMSSFRDRSFDVSR
jgi:short-subunit dehydrogenase